MSGFESLKNLRSAKATRALLLLSIFLFSAGPGLAAGLAPAGMPRFNPGNEGLYEHSAPTTIKELYKQYSKDTAPTKGILIDRDLQSQSKDQDSFTHEHTVEHGMPPNSNNNKNNNCESNSDHSILELHEGNAFVSDASACKHAPGIWGDSGSCCKNRSGSGS
jgi:hypothetical protein